MGNKEIRTPHPAGKSGKEKKKLSKKQKTVLLISLSAAAVLAISGALTGWLLSRFSPSAADAHTAMNALPETLDSTVAFKDGGIYLCSPGSVVLVDDNVYDADDDVNSIAYFWDCSDNTLIYLSDPNGEKRLMRYKDGRSEFLIKNVNAWRVSPDRSKIAAVINAGETGLGGTLVLLTEGKSELLDYNVKAETVYFTQDSSALFAQTGNDNFGELHCYRDGDSFIVDKSIFAMGWLSPDGQSYLSVEVSDTAYIYNYTLKSLSGRSLSFKNVVYSEASPDGSIMYILHDYDSQTQLGTLTVADTSSFRTFRIAEKVYAANHTAVTDTARGIVYATAGSMENRYNIYYFDVPSCKSITLAQNAYGSTLGSIAVNSAKNSGYMLLMGNTAERSQLYSFSLAGGKMTAEKLDEGAIYEILYFEACDRLLYSANGDVNKVELYTINGGQSERMLKNCGAIYDSSTAAYYSCSILSNDGAYTVYLKNTVIIDETDDDPFEEHPNADIYGTLMLRRNQDGELFVISGNVLADSFSCIQADAKGQNIFFSVLTQEGKFDICHYDTLTGEKTVLLAGADLMADYQ
ncbi:MAG: hypothetical protein PUC05_08170 [Firmicutes bacterium]|nr:hypothetical protein [Bacillota bacterium]